MVGCLKKIKPPEDGSETEMMRNDLDKRRSLDKGTES